LAMVLLALPCSAVGFTVFRRMSKRRQQAILRDKVADDIAECIPHRSAPLELGDVKPPSATVQPSRSMHRQSHWSRARAPPGAIEDPARDGPMVAPPARARVVESRSHALETEGIARAEAYERTNQAHLRREKAGPCTSNTGRLFILQPAPKRRDREPRMST